MTACLRLLTLTLPLLLASACARPPAFHAMTIVYRLHPGTRAEHVAHMIERELPGAAIQPSLAGRELDALEPEARATSGEAVEALGQLARFRTVRIPATVPLATALALITSLPGIESAYVDTGVIPADTAPPAAEYPG